LCHDAIDVQQVPHVWWFNTELDVAELLLMLLAGDMNFG